MSEVVRDDVEAGRFELAVGAAIAFVDYQRSGRTLVLRHAEVPAELEGRGVGSRLVRAVLELARARGERVVPRCPFIARYLERHPEYQDLVASDAR
ncbi:MAG TPA: GNAT family N-acetyltransferase [Steroidobacteraceae bacterium]|nr:GNAT family N-acetyltransferase [Steroidobacteraceae bacterium]